MASIAVKKSAMLMIAMAVPRCAGSSGSYGEFHGQLDAIQLIRPHSLPAHHSCPLSCHAPSACNESEACSAMITLSCPCGRFQQPTKCGRCTSNPNKAFQQLHCRDECAIAKRNARLAEALGISPETKEKTNVTYPEDLVTYGKANAKFVVLVENTLNK